jgi:hypothetical protein
LEGDYANAQKTLDAATEYRATMITLSQRKQAVSEHLRIKDEWSKHFRTWNIVHYVLGIAALFCSSLVAAKPAWFGFQDSFYGLLAWVVAFLTGLLTFLSPDGKARRYQRAWSILNSEITRYNADYTYTLNDVIEAYQQGEHIISQTQSDVSKLIAPPTSAAKA